ncbi:MAG TPA: hypothetical protein PL149_02530 [Candidatus Kapabacteria bacterium]|nr:hypothetical protein [Candidatus Kapabacteria bacterium]
MLTALIIVAILASIALIFAALSIVDTAKSYKLLAENAQKNLDKITSDTNELKTRLIQSLDELSIVKSKLLVVLDEVVELKNDISASLQSVDSLAKTIDNSAQNVGDKVEILFKKLEPLKNLSKALYSMIANPVNNSITLFNATKKAISTFTGKLFGK